MRRIRCSLIPRGRPTWRPFASFDGAGVGDAFPVPGGADAGPDQGEAQVARAIGAIGAIGAMLATFDMDPGEAEDRLQDAALRAGIGDAQLARAILQLLFPPDAQGLNAPPRG